MQTNATQELQQAIERLYEVFALYPLKPHIYGCDHCVSPQDNARIRSKPLRGLDWDDLQRFAHKSISTWGDVDDFKHFLPRLLELVPEENRWPISVDRLCLKIYEADFQEWLEIERAVVNAYFLALWRAIISTDDVTIEPYEFLDALVDVQLPVQPLLDVWEHTIAHDGAMLHKLTYFVDRVAWEYAPRPTDSSSFIAEEATAVSEQDAWAGILRWLTSPQLREHLEQQNSDFAGELSQTMLQLSTLQTAEPLHM
ncbi:MAG TPA: hypothetical protein VF952_20785 [Chloroflexia bacterium]|jgi:hypothetical protein